ncbi:MAG TPA: hypothetical protein VFR24_27475 [Candidatus Angelobacter sp.]|nr:hypothetical protein [Candidatus Angelobacter sp.]
MPDLKDFVSQLNNKPAQGERSSLDPILINSPLPTLPPLEVQDAVRGLLHGVGSGIQHVYNLPKQVFQESENLRNTGDFNPAPFVETAGYLTGVGAPMSEIGSLGSFGGKINSSEFRKQYLDTIPIEDRLKRTGISHPGYRFEVYDPKTNQVMGKPYINAPMARSRVDKLDNQYGAYRYRTRQIKAPQLLPEEEQRLKDLGLYEGYLQD